MTRRREKNKPQPQTNKQLAVQQETAPSREKDENLIELGKFFYGLAQLVFGGGVLGIVLDFVPEKVLDLVLSFVGTVMLAVTAWVFIKLGNKK